MRRGKESDQENTERTRGTWEGEARSDLSQDAISMLLTSIVICMEGNLERQGATLLLMGRLSGRLWDGVVSRRA